MITETIKRQTEPELINEIELYFAKYPSGDYNTRIFDVLFDDRDQVWVAIINRDVY
jgi:hypothetical protein